MVTHNITTSTSTGYNTSADNEKWILAAGVTVNVAGDNAFFGGKEFTGNTFVFSGAAETTGNVVTCLMKAAHTWITVMGTGSITSEMNAISMLGKGSTVINRGTINAVDFAVRLYEQNAYLKNEGDITSDNTCINVVEAKSEVENYDLIQGKVGISVTADSGAFDFYNAGIVDGSKYAYVGGNARESVTNAGTIQGDVYLRNGTDVFKSEGGTVTGNIYGGNGDDTYYIDALGLSIIEINLGGHDRVVSSISYVLGSYVDNLSLSGPDSINGTGNSLANRIVGNAQNNVISGLGGRDFLDGAAGDDQLNGNLGNDSLIGNQGKDTLNGGGGVDRLNGGIGGDRISGGDMHDVIVGGLGYDRLIGGTGADTFIFADGHGKDVITDFQATGKLHDTIDLSRLSTVANFADLIQNHTQQVGNDVVITDGSSQLVLKNVDVADLSAKDFLF